MKHLLPVACVCVVLSACASGASLPNGYVARVSLPLAPGPDRMRGRLELLEDARIRPAMRPAISEAFGGDPCAEGPEAVLRSLCDGSGHSPLRPALLRLLDARGRIVTTYTAERPLADLSVTRLYGSERRTYVFTVDLSAGVGSYSGPYTRFAEPEAGSFGWLTADGAGVATDTITLVSTLKTAWRATPRVDGRGEDLLMVMCRPDLAAPDSSTDGFILTFRRYTFDGRHWLVRQREVRGCYESDEAFPAAARFP